MALHAPIESASATPLALTTTDLWKAAGLLLVLADHVGLYLDPDNLWWRVVGRAALPIFFFFIGYARSREVPLLWPLMGAGLMAFGSWLDGGFEANCLNILFSFAVIRLALRPLDRLLVAPRVAAAGLAGQFVVFALLIGVLVVAMPYANPLLEYGTEGAILALAGLAVRRATDSGAIEANHLAMAVMMTAGAIYIAAEWSDFGFDLMQGTALGALVALVCFWLLYFKRAPSHWQPNGAMRSMLAFCGRHSLELYALQVVSLALLGEWLEDEE